MTTENGKLIAKLGNAKYATLLAATLPGVITDDAELERLTQELDRMVTKGIKQNRLDAEQEKLVALLTQLIEDYERQQETLTDLA